MKQKEAKTRLTALKAVWEDGNQGQKELAEAIGIAIKAMDETQAEWYEEQFTSCGSILQMRLNVIQQRCSKCERWSIKWEGTIPSNYCSHCGAKMRSEG